MKMTFYSPREESPYDIALEKDEEELHSILTDYGLLVSDYESPETYLQRLEAFEKSASFSTLPEGERGFITEFINDLDSLYDVVGMTKRRDENEIEHYARLRGILVYPQVSQLTRTVYDTLLDLIDNLDPFGTILYIVKHRTESYISEGTKRLQ